MQYLKQSTATTLKIGPFLDDTDGKTAETGLSITQADVRLSKNGGNIAQKTEGTSCIHDELGIYGCPIDATDTASLGRLQLWVHESGALPVWEEYLVVTANFYDSLFSTDKLQVDVTQIGGVAQSATDLKDFADTGYDPATNKVEGVKLADTTTTNTDMRGTDSAALAATSLSTTTWTAAKAAFLDHSIATVDGIVDTILADTNELQTDWVNGGRLDLILDRLLDVMEIRHGLSVNDVSASTTKFITTMAEGAGFPWERAAVLFTSGANDGLMRRIETYNGTTKEVTIQTPLNAAPADGDTFVMPAIRAFLTPDIEDIADHVSDEILADHTIAGSLAKGITDTLTDTAEIGTAGAGLIDLGGMSTNMKNEVNSEASDVMTVDTTSEPPQGPPPATPTFEQIFAYMYFRMMNKNEETATEHAVYNVAGTTKVIKASVSDVAGTLTKGEFESGA